MMPSRHVMSCFTLQLFIEHVTCVSFVLAIPHIILAASLQMLTISSRGAS